MKYNRGIIRANKRTQRTGQVELLLPFNKHICKLQLITKIKIVTKLSILFHLASAQTCMATGYCTVLNIVPVIFWRSFLDTWADVSLCGIQEERFLHTFPESNPLVIFNIKIKTHIRVVFDFKQTKQGRKIFETTELPRHILIWICRKISWRVSTSAHHIFWSPYTGWLYKKYKEICLQELEITLLKPRAMKWSCRWSVNHLTQCIKLNIRKKYVLFFL